MPVGDFVTTAVHGVLHLRAGQEGTTLRYDCGDLVVGNLLGRGPHRVSFSCFVTGNGLDPNGRELVAFLRANEVFDVEYVLDLTDHGPRDRNLAVHTCHTEDVEFRESTEGNRLVFAMVGERVTGNLLPWLDPAVSAGGAA